MSLGEDIQLMRHLKHYRKQINMLMCVKYGPHSHRKRFDQPWLCKGYVLSSLSTVGVRFFTEIAN